MHYEKSKNKITIFDPVDFNAVQILNSGQIFRYVIDGNSATVNSKDKIAFITTFENRVEIESSDIDYFECFFDLQVDYGEIKKILKKDSFLAQAVDFGYGIRILKNDLFEMIVSFIISANNNIGRIKKSIEYLCQHFGTKMGNYYAFPTLQELKKASVNDYIKAGLGYRAEQMYDTILRLTVEDVEKMKLMNVKDVEKYLISFKGIGPKVANCIMLFGLGIQNVFPVDTWINKVYNKLTNTTTTDRKKISRELTARYGELSGIAQQYFFYYFRDNKLQ